MSIKKYLKRVCKYIITGVPNVNVDVKVVQDISGQKLKDKVILVTGGSKGIGYEIAKRCISEGAKVIIVSRKEEELKKVSKEFGDNCKYVCFDVSDFIHYQDFYEKVNKQFGKIDCLVNNAGISLHEKNLLDVPLENFDTQFNINLKAPYFLAQLFIKNKKEKLNILFITSERGFQCDDIPYGLTKCSINSLVKGISKRFYREGVRSNAIAPGVTASKMTGRTKNGNKFEEKQSAGRYFMPEEIAETAVFLLSDSSVCISGEIVACDAGQYISSYF